MTDRSGNGRRCRQESRTRCPIATHSKQSTAGGKAGRKPSKDFPLSIHKGTGYWCKKVRGVVYYFGKVADDPKGTAALAEWLRVRDDRLAGREPRIKTDELSVA